MNELWIAMAGSAVTLLAAVLPTLSEKWKLIGVAMGLALIAVAGYMAFEPLPAATVRSIGSQRILQRNGEAVAVTPNLT